MKATQLLSNLGQSIWLDNITRDLLDHGTLKYYKDELCITGLTSNPTIFEKAIKNSSAYDAAIDAGLSRGNSSEETFFDLALEDITRAARLFQPIHERTNTVDGRVSLEVSPLLARDTKKSLRAAKDLFSRAACGNLLIKIPGTREGLPAIEGAIFAGIPINVTLLFSPEQYLAAADAFLRDPAASDILYVRELAAPFTVNTMPQDTLKALAKYRSIGSILPPDGGDSAEVLAQFSQAGVDISALAARLQEEGAASFTKSWYELMGVIESKSSVLKKAG